MTPAELDQKRPPGGNRSPEPLALSARCRIWGETSAASADGFDRAGRADTASPAHQANDGRQTRHCRYCGFASVHHVLDHANDNHSDNSQENLGTSDQLCHGWRHTESFAEQQAVIAYLPGLAPRDINHLQRTLMVALQCEDETARSDAMEIVNWAASHREYTKQAWGTYLAERFAEAFSAGPLKNDVSREFALAGLALIYHPHAFAETARLWSREAYAAHPADQWSRIYHANMNAPA